MYISNNDQNLLNGRYLKIKKFFSKILVSSGADRGPQFRKIWFFW